MMTAPDMAERPMLQHALEYLALGYPVFPVCSPLMGSHDHWSNEKQQRIDCPPEKRGKNPMGPWKALQTGLPSVEQVRAWWSRWPTANIGMATGELSGVIVLDCDDGEAGRAALDRGGLEKAPAVWTGKPGGIHFWIQHPGYSVKNFVREIDGTDFRGDGGYVLLPPSKHAKGAFYRWNEHTLGMKPPPVPPWLEPSLQGRSSDDGGPIGNGFDLEAVLNGIKEGARDQTLWSYAGKLRADDVPQAYAEQLIRQAARLCDPPFDEDTAVEKVRRAYREYEPNVEGPPFDLSDLDNGPLWVVGAEPSPPIPLLESETDEAPVGWRVYNAEEFLAIEYPAIEWRVEGYLREKAILFSFGPPGSIKTYVATDAALAIASGDMFLNRFPCQQGRVLVVQEDTLGSDYQQAYLRPMMAARGITGADVRDTLFIAPPADFSFDQASRLNDLCEWLKEYTPDLLVVDSFYLMYSGKKEDLIEVMKLLKKIRNKFGCAIWIIDHNRKSQGQGSQGEDAIDRLINGREKSAAVDVVMESRSVKGESGSVFLDVLKQRGVKLPEPIRVTYADGRLTVDGDEPESPKGSAQVMYEWMCREGGSRTKEQIARGCDLSARSVNYAMGELVMSGLAMKSGKQGRSALWIAVRKADAAPVTAPNFEFGGDEDV
jgi:hypothetical protein